MIGVRPIGTHGVVTLVSIGQLDVLKHQEFGLNRIVVPIKDPDDDPDDHHQSSSSSSVTTPSSPEEDGSPSLQLLSRINLPPQDKERLKRAAHILRQRLILRLWLDDHGLLEYAHKFNSLGVNSIEDAYWFEDVGRLEESIGEKIVPMWTVARQSLPAGLAPLETLKNTLWNRIISLDHQSIWNTWGTMLLVTLSVAGFGAVASYFPQEVSDAKQAILQYVSGKFSLASNCRVDFDWTDPVQVGQTVSFSIRFFQRGGRPYPVCDRDSILVEVKKDSQKVAVVVEFGGKDATADANLVVVKFSVRKAGKYAIHVMVENSHVKGSPFAKTFVPAPIDPHKTLFLKQTSTVVCVTGQNHKLIVEPRDAFGNLCSLFHLNLFQFNATQVSDDSDQDHHPAAAEKPGEESSQQQQQQQCSVQFSHEPPAAAPAPTAAPRQVVSKLFGRESSPAKIASQQELSPPAAHHPHQQHQLPSSLSTSSFTSFDSGRVCLQIRFPEPGVYHGMLRYGDKPVQHGRFEIVVLSSAEAAAVQRNVQGKSSGNSNNYYEGRLLQVGNNDQQPKKVYLSVTSKQLVIKEYLWKLLPLRVATFRLSPNTKLQFITTRTPTTGNQQQQQQQQPLLLIDDGSQPAIRVAVKDAKVVVATFTHFLLRNIGGSETFHDKQEHFFKELRDLHRKHPRDKQTLKITRENIIESTWKATKGLSSSDWCRNFEISFIGEQGIDWGGLRREWFEQVCSRLFEAGNAVGMFSSFGESRLVHPNPNSRWKPKQYEMAGRIVGKCLFESSLGSAYRQMVKAKFTRSFLAQLIGLRVSFKHFEQDDPELYLRKVKFILENDVDGMELTFTEEEYDHQGKLLKTVDLVGDGSKLLVTNVNKREYLNALAQFRLATRVRTQVDAFLKGLNDVVPDELLSIFDENELELLMCGTSEYSVTELREHHVVCGGGGAEFRRVLDWFWTAVANMTEEEKARLLQFTTGCSQLPPGGFRELSPLFQLTPAPTHGNLPTAHTCFNQLCLPDYHTYEHFEKAIRIAINEGAEGFGLI